MEREHHTLEGGRINGRTNRVMEGVESGKLQHGGGESHHGDKSI